MANKRMFNMKIVDSDAFLDMPLSAQCLYFHLNMRADDEGFVGNTKRIMKMIGSNDDDLKILIMKGFVIEFESGLVVIKHWWMHNTILKDRFHQTSYMDERQLLGIKDNKAYTLNINQIEEKPKKEIRHKYGEYKHVQLTDEQYEKLKNDFPLDYEKRITDCDEYCEQFGKKYDNYYLTIKKWAKKDIANSSNKRTEELENYSTTNNPVISEEARKRLKERLNKYE